VTVIAVGGENFGMSKSTGNLQFSLTYRALLKNTIDLEERTAPGVAWRKATEYFVSVRNNFDQEDTAPFKRCRVDARSEA
jgi:hypothetical protein